MGDISCKYDYIRTCGDVYCMDNGLLRGDFKTRMEGYAIGRQNGWYSVNDIRELEDMNKIPAEEGGDDYLCNGNMTKLRLRY